MSNRRTFQLVSTSLAIACATAVITGCSDAVVQADREQQKIDSSPESKRRQREAAQKGVDDTTKALEGMEGAFGAGSQPNQQPKEPPKETPK